MHSSQSYWQMTNGPTAIGVDCNQWNMRFCTPALVTKQSEEGCNRSPRSPCARWAGSHRSAASSARGESPTQAAHSALPSTRWAEISPNTSGQLPVRSSRTPVKGTLTRPARVAAVLPAAVRGGSGHKRGQGGSCGACSSAGGGGGCQLLPRGNAAGRAPLCAAMPRHPAPTLAAGQSPAPNTMPAWRGAMSRWLTLTPPSVSADSPRPIVIRPARRQQPAGKI